MIARHELFPRFDRVRQVRPGEWVAACPAHDDRSPSLHITEKRDKWLLHCHANCDLEAVLAAARLAWADLFASNANGRHEVAAYRYVDEAGRPLFEVVRFHPKDFRQRRPDSSGGYIWNLDGTRRVLYRLPQVIAAVARGATVFIAEGEKDVHALERAGLVATCSPMGAGKWREEFCGPLTGANVVVVADRDEPGREHAREVAASLAGRASSVALVEPTRGDDAQAHLAAGGAVAEFVPLDQAQEPAPAASPPVEIDGAELLGELRAFVGRFVVLPSEEAADLVALWVLHTHALEAARATPYLRITSAAPESGKTLLLEVLAALCRHGWHAVNPSTAVLYRRIDRDTPTLLLDELDNYSLRDRQESLAVLNAGYRRGARVDRVADNGALQAFGCFCPKAFAGLDARELPPTLLSRSVTIRMEPKLEREPVEMWLPAYAEGDADPKPLHDACAAWAEREVEGLGRLRPQLPPGLRDRSAEVWWPLLAIAEHVGGDWPERARRAATTLAAGGDASDAPAEPVQLLADVRDAFGSEPAIATAALLMYLNALEESPWGAKRNGLGLDAHGLARPLRKFRTPEGAPIRPKVVRVGTGTPRGYAYDQFADAFARYLPQAQQAQQAQHRRPEAARDVADVADVADPRQGPDDQLAFASEAEEAEFERLRAKYGSA